MKSVLGLGVTVALFGAGQAPPSEMALLARLAIELAAERDVAPISLDPDGSGAHGVVYDRFTTAHLAARVALEKGTPLNPLRPPSSFANMQMVVVAVPLVCGERTVRPVDVDIDHAGTPVPKWQPATGATIQTLLPGAKVPPGAIAVQFQDTMLRRGHTVKISYAAAICSGASRTVSLPVTTADARALERPSVDMQAGEQAPSGPVTLDLGGVVDLDGRLRYGTAAETTTPFGKAALATALKMRFEPARINRSPTPWTAGVIVTFGAAAPAAAPESTTPDEPSLTAASSKCRVSEDPAYGVSGLNAIRIGGGADSGARQLQYLSVLRGPAGQGLRYQSVGRVMVAGPRMTMLDGFEVRYAGVDKPIRIYFDASREEPLMAPNGFTCVAPILKF